jgi:hypothetical protein
MPTNDPVQNSRADTPCPSLASLDEADDVFTSTTSTQHVPSTTYSSSSAHVPTSADAGVGAPAVATNMRPYGNQFRNPPSSLDDWIPAHRRHPYGGLPEHRIHFAVPSETLEQFPPRGSGMGYGVKKWYAVCKGYDIGIFFDYW